MAALGVAIALLAASVATIWALGSPRIDIARPRLGVPAIRLAGEAIEIEVMASHPLATWAAPGDCSVALTDWRGTTVVPARASRTGATRYSLSIELPPELASGSYDLSVTANGLVARRRRAVHVVAAFEEELTIVQLADLPTFGGDGTGDREMERIIDEVALLDPDVLLVTGDIAYGGTEEQFATFVHYLERLEVPAIVAAGNHEYDGWAFYLEHFGRPWHAVDYGPLRFLSLNSAHGRDQLTASQYAWFSQAIAARDGRTPIVQVHHPIFGGWHVRARVERFLRDLDEHGVPIVLSGHNHADRVFDRSGEIRSDTWKLPPTIFAVTTAAGADLRPERGDSPPHHGYRVLRMRGGEVLSYTYDWDGDGQLDPACSHPVGLLEVLHVEPGTAIVRNGLTEGIDGALVRMSVPGEQPEPLVADIGEVEEVRKTGSETTYLVRIDLPPQSELTISLRSEAGAGQ